MSVCLGLGVSMYYKYVSKGGASMYEKKIFFIVYVTDEYKLTHSFF